MEGRVRPFVMLLGFHSDRPEIYPDFWKCGHEYVSDRAAKFKFKHLNPRRVLDVLEDKSAFARFLEGSGLTERAPRPLGEVLNGEFLPATSLSDSAHGVVVKPRRGEGGSGVRIFPDIQSLQDALPAGDFIDAIVQERIPQHDLIHEIAPWALNTIRILAVRDSGQQVILASAAHRFSGSNTGVVDNVTAGGSVAQVDLESGLMSRVVSFDYARRLTVTETHPDSGILVEGVRVPYWNEAKKLVVDVMDALPDARHVGWDIAIALDGPVVIEGNAAYPNPRMLQLHGPSLFQDVRMVDFYHELGVINNRQYRKLQRLYSSRN